VSERLDRLFEALSIPVAIRLQFEEDVEPEVVNDRILLKERRRGKIDDLRKRVDLVIRQLD
jgi:hypothetical protein